MHVQRPGGDYSLEAGEPGLNAASPPAPGSVRPVRPAVRPADARARDEFLQLLARGVQQFHTYPAGSPICQQTVESCLRALVSLESRDQVTFRITPHELIVDEEPTGRGTLIEFELARRLHAAFIAQVTVERVASARELSRFCAALIRCGDRSAPPMTLLELLAEYGVDRIALQPADRPEVLSISANVAPVQHLIDHERQRRNDALAAGGPVNHLYKPGKGWVRVDPSTPLDTVSLIDLALLAENPTALAHMLIRLTDGEVADVGGSGDALAQKYSDVARLFAAMDPRVSRVMFAKLARAVLDLDSERRQTLLKRTILPGLLDGRMDGAVLRDFPDLELADSLCLLLDLEAAAPEVVTAALSRLELPAERQAAMLPLLEERVQTKMTGSVPQDNTVDTHARRLVRIDRDRAKNVAEFAAFDLAVDRDTRDVLSQIRDGIVATDTTSVQLDCLYKLSRLEPNPETVEQFSNRARPLLQALEQAQRWPAFAAWMGRYRDLADSLRDTRPEVADLLRGHLSKLCTPEHATLIVSLAEHGEEGKAQAATLIGALGPEIARHLVAIAGTPAGRAAGHVVCEHASLLAPTLASMAQQADTAGQRMIARALGIAGQGYESALEPLLRSRDEQTVREALRALARIGTSQAASLVASRIQEGRDWIAAAAEQTLWHFPKPEADRQVIDLLSRRDFIVRQPLAAARLMDHAPREHTTAAILEPLQTLRYRIWNPSLARIGRKARALLAG